MLCVRTSTRAIGKAVSLGRVGVVDSCFIARSPYSSSQAFGTVRQIGWYSSVLSSTGSVCRGNRAAAARYQVLLRTDRPVASRSLATTSPQKGDDEIILYKRQPVADKNSTSGNSPATSSYTLLRTGIGFSSFHTMYWLWYVTDFIPAVNASPMEQLHVDPMLGVVGFVFALTIQAVFFLYPLRLLSQVSFRPSEGTLVLYNHKLPWVRPATKETLVVPVGELILDPQAVETNTILTECHGNLELFRGRLLISNNKNRNVGTKGATVKISSSSKLWFPYLMEIRSSREVVERDLLLEALLYPDQLALQQHRSQNGLRGKQRKKRESKLRKIARARR